MRLARRRGGRNHRRPLTLVEAAAERARRSPCSGTRNIGPGLVASAVTLLSVVALVLERDDAGSSRLGETLPAGGELAARPSGGGRGRMASPAAGRPLAPVYATMVLWVVVGGYVSDLAIDGLSRAALRRDVDSRVAAVRQLFPAGCGGAERQSRDPGCFAAFGRPDVGLELVAWWTLIATLSSTRYASPS